MQRPALATPNAGRRGRRWNRIKAEARLRETHCYRCGQPLDKTIPYRDPDTGNTNPNYASAEHKVPRSIAPHLAEDPANIGVSHLICNQSAGNRLPTPVLGVRSREM